MPITSTVVYLRNVDFLVLILVEVSLNEFFKVSKTHLPCLALLGLHLIKASLAKTTSDMFFKTVVQESTSA